jgi:hypothetical protein
MMHNMKRFNPQIFILFAVPSYVGVRPAGSCISLLVGESIKYVAQFLTECPNQTVIEVETQKPAGEEITSIPDRVTAARFFR